MTSTIAAFVALLFAQTEISNSEYRERIIQFYKEQAAAYDFHLKGDEEPLTFHATPLHLYYQQAQGVMHHGAIFVWTKNGRPQLIGSIWTYAWSENNKIARSVNHEFHALAQMPLEPVKIGNHEWHPQTGVELMLVPDAPDPSDKAALRLAQMRQIARQLQGFSTRTTTRKELKLRVLPQPLYRYSEPEEPDVLDGAAFAFFSDWDPEIMLLVEARKTPQGPKWHYSMARFNYTPQRLERDGVVVWEVQWRPRGQFTRGVPEEPFFAVHRVETVYDNQFQGSGED